MTSKFRYEPVIRVFTLLGYCIEENDNYEETLARQIENKNSINPTTIMEAGCICSDYEGKKEAMDKKDLNFKNCVELVDGEIVIIEGKQYKTKYLGNYSDPIHFKPV